MLPYAPPSQPPRTPLAIAKFRNRPVLNCHQTVRIPFPDRFELRYVLLFIAVLFLAQQIEGTNIFFSLLCSLYVGLFALAFNVAGGLNYPSGAYIFFNGVIAVILGISYKAILREPAELNLLSPVKTMVCFCLGMAAMLVAAFVNANVRPRHGLLTGFIQGEALKRAAIGCLFVGLFLSYTTELGFNSDGSIAAAFRQLNRFLQMAIILATTYEITHSKGKRSSNWIVWVAGGWIFAVGLFGYSKEGIFTAPVTWLLPALALRFRFSKKQIALFLVASFLAVFYLIPFSQYGRKNRNIASRSEAISVLLPLLLHLQNTRELYLDQLDAVETHDAPQYFTTNQGLMEREEMLAYDDAIIHYTDQGNVFGLLPVYTGFTNIVPHFLWPNKPTSTPSNEYGHELGVLSTDDLTTGISFSPTGDAYHEAEWFGLIIVMPLVMFFTFFATDSITGSVKEAPWALLPFAIFAHVAPEGLLQGAIYAGLYGNLAVILVAVLSRYVLPVATNLVMGPLRAGRGSVQRTLNFTPQPARRRTRNLPNAAQSPQPTEPGT